MDVPAIIARIKRLAEAGKVVGLAPDTARYVAMYSALTMRPGRSPLDVIRAFKGRDCNRACLGEEQGDALQAVAVLGAGSASV